jgi:hypothetical protein
VARSFSSEHEERRSELRLEAKRKGKPELTVLMYSLENSGGVSPLEAKPNVTSTASERRTVDVAEYGVEKDLVMIEDELL